MSDARVYDINCDMGESFGNWRMGDDRSMIHEVTTANVACGFHAGDPVTMWRTVELAKEHGVAVGAHPGTPDLLGFGRRTMSLNAEDTYAYLVFQVGALKAFLERHGMPLAHIKPHGAMERILNDDELAVAACEAMRDTMENPVLFWPTPLGRHALSRAAEERGITVVGVLYPDLSYGPDGQLVIERHKGETDIPRVEEQVRRFMNDGEVETTVGTRIAVEATSFCVHGDGPNSVEVAKAVRRVVEECGGVFANAGALA